MKDRRRLARILRIKERQRDACRAELAHANRALQEAERRMDEVSLEHEAAIGELVQPGEATADELVTRAKIVALAGQVMASAKEQVTVRAEERRDKQQRLDGAQRALRSLEVLDQRLVAEQARRTRRREQGENDETAARGWYRR